MREGIGGKVIVRTGRRLPGIAPMAGVHWPISVVRMAVEDAYGAKQWRAGEPGADDEVAYREEHITRSTCRAVSEYAFRTANRVEARVYGGPKWTVSAIYEGMLKEEMDAAAARHPDVDYQPVLIDATYAGLLSGATDKTLVIPALNRDGDCLSDLVLPMFGSIAGAESILLAFDDSYNTTVAMAEAPHGTAPALLGKDLANPLAMILACGAVMHHAADRAGAHADHASRAIYEAALETVASGVRRSTWAARPAPPNSPVPWSTESERSSRSGRRSVEPPPWTVGHTDAVIGGGAGRAAMKIAGKRGIPSGPGRSLRTYVP